MNCRRLDRGGGFLQKALAFPKAIQYNKLKRASGVEPCRQNDYRGTVTMELQGTGEQIGRVLEMLERAPWIRIENINSRTIPVDPDEHDFVTRDDEW